MQRKVMTHFSSLFSVQYRFLTFQKVSFEPTLFKSLLGFGLLCTWLAGIGRYWDHPNAALWQYMGIGSLAYIVVMAFLIFVIARPLRPKHWRYENVLLFVSLTSLPALLYAIPVEQFMTLPMARTVNVWFLAIVATWRVALLFKFLMSVAKLSIVQTIVTTLLPLTMIVTALTMLNLERAVFDIMAGLSNSHGTANDAAYRVLISITFFSILALPVILSAYVWLIKKARDPF